MPERLQMLETWLQNVLASNVLTLVPITNDASFRRYFRVTLNGNNYIAMDAPPDKEDCRPFVDITKRLLKAGVNAPEIIASDIENGFLLLTDFGSTLYLSQLNEANVEKLYGDAIQALIVIQRHASIENLPPYDNALLHREMGLFDNWLVNKHLNFSMSYQEQQRLYDNFELLSNTALKQPITFVHRDYHSRNLMITEQNNPGILDFQDAVVGPMTYDLVSLLRDCYISWPREKVETWALNYYQQAQDEKLFNDMSEIQFLQWFDWMGIQRHLKASGIFARLYHRDGKDGYLGDIPRTLNYIVEVGEMYPELTFLHQFVTQVVDKFNDKSLNNSE